MLDCPPLLGPLSTPPISTFVIFLNLSSVNLGSLVCACESVVNHGPTSYSTSLFEAKVIRMYKRRPSSLAVFSNCYKMKLLTSKSAAWK